MNLSTFIHRFLTPRHLVTNLVGSLASARLGKLTTLMIKGFAKWKHIDLSQAKKSPEEFKSFNQFFVRELKPGLRPLGTKNFVSPADGKVAASGTITNGTIIQAKGQDYTTRELLGLSAEEAAKYDGCPWLTVYLSPRDYHRVHMPCAAELRKTVFVPGDLYSVNDNAIKHIEALYARNERLICYFDTQYGPMVQILVGATITGSIDTSWDGVVNASHGVRIIEKNYARGEVVFNKGDYMGAFLMGSTTINIFPQGTELNAFEVKAPILQGQDVAGVAGFPEDKAVVTEVAEVAEAAEQTAQAEPVADAQAEVPAEESAVSETVTEVAEKAEEAVVEATGQAEEVVELVVEEPTDKSTQTK